MLEYLKKIFYILGKDRDKLPLLMLLFFITAALDVIGIGLIAPYIALVMGDGFINETWMNIVNYLNLPNDHLNLLIIAGSLLILVFLFRTVAIIWINSKIVFFGTSQASRLSAFLMKSYQCLPYADYLNRNSSEYVYAIQTLSPKFSFVLISVLRVVSDIIVAVFIIVYLATQNIAALAILIILLGSVIYLYDRKLRVKIKRYGKRANKSSTKLVQSVQEGVSGLKEIRVLRKESYFYDAVKLSAKENSYCMAKTQILSAIPRFLLELILVLFVVLFVVITILTDGNLKDLAPTLGMFLVASLRLLPTANTFSSAIMNLRHSFDTISRLYCDLVDIDSRKSVTKEGVHVNINFERFSMNNVSFSYSKDSSQIIKNISLKIKKNEVIGIMGESGSGKTTAVNVLLGFLDAQDGYFYFNDIKTKKGLMYWSDKIAYLPQDVFLMDDSIKKNIALGEVDNEINTEKVCKSLEKTFLMDLIRSLPQGIDTQVGEKGVRLSGGQRQRLALARALYYDSSIIVMDESTSALDNKTENEIVEEIRKLKGSVTMIIIAHRLSTLKYCDRIYEFKGGKAFEVQ
jgi:ATP-binding cassette, subfamily B, bacterial PglK